MRGGIAEIVRKVFAIDGMPLVLATACAGALREKLEALLLGLCPPQLLPRPWSYAPGAI